MLQILLHTVPAIKVALLANHDPAAWSGSCADSAATKAACNTRLYDQAISVAAAGGADLVHFPEAYGLQSIHDPFEPFASANGSQPCAASSSASPQQLGVACSAARYNVSVAANFFVMLSNGTKRIMEIIYDWKGSVVSSYSKHHLVPLFESAFAESGPFAPTTFVIGGVRFGIVVCYEGVYPSLFGDWSQFDALLAQGADAILWAIGDMVPDDHVATDISKKYSTIVLASENTHAAVAVDAEGQGIALTTTPLAVSNYTAQAAVSMAEVALPLRVRFGLVESL